MLSFLQISSPKFSLGLLGKGKRAFGRLDPIINPLINTSEQLLELNFGQLQFRLLLGKHLLGYFLSQSQIQQGIQILDAFVVADLMSMQ